MISPTINFRVLLLAVLPVTVVPIVFFGYFFTKQINDAEANIIAKGKSLAVHLAIASEYGIFSGKTAILSPLVESAFTENDIISITIINKQGTPLIKKSRIKNSPFSTSTSEKKRNHIFSQPVIHHTVNIDDVENAGHNTPPVIGWVIIQVSNEPAQENKRKALFQMLSMILLISVGSIFLVKRISCQIKKPVSLLTSTIKKIEDGNLDTSVKTHSTGALLTLEKGVHSMLKSIKSSREKDQDIIDKTTKELQQSQKLLEQKNAELTTARQQALSVNQENFAFLTRIEHETTSPMNKILGFVTLLKNTNPTQDQTDYLYTIEKSANSLLRAINNAAYFSKIETGTVSTNNTHFNLEDCIEDVLTLVAPSAHEKGIELSSLYYDDTPKELFGLCDHIRQTFITLIDNAITLSEQGTIMVRTMMESQENETVKIKITITDQGTDFSKKDNAAMLGTFGQADESNTHQPDNNEPDLSTPEILTGAMHEKTGIERHEDGGSTYWFTFECQCKTFPESVNKDKPLPYYNKSITLYDANELTRISLVHAFQRLGFDVVECTDIEHLCNPQKTSGMPDICVLSISGNKTAETTIPEFLASQRDHTQSKILVIVSQSDPHVFKTLRDQGADACISKPFRRTDFEKKLATIFRIPKNFYGQKSKIDPAHKPSALTRLDGLNILIAEDNAVNARLTETILYRAGAIPNIVGNGKEAVAAFNREKFDVILMDIHMPEMNGVDAARKIREIESSSTRIGIIGLTAATHYKNGPLSQNPDFDEVLKKPIAMNTLLTAITYWTHAYKSARGNRQTNPRPTNNLGIDKDLSTTLNEMLLHELPKTKEKLQTAHDAKNTHFLRDEIHRLLGGLAYCDFTELHQLTLRYQTSLKTDENTTDEDFQKMIAEMNRLSGTKNA